MSAMPGTAREIAAAVRSGQLSAVEIVEAALARIQRNDGDINSFTHVTAERARAEARAIDARARSHSPVPPLAGVPYAVKNLFDVAGLPTLAGSRINEAHAPAATDATLVTRLREAGAMLLGTLNMDAYAYGFTTENTAYGSCHNPHDPARSAGGSSGGSAAAVAAGFVPLSLGSDTNGSIRVPASFCGVFGLKPTFGRLPRTGSAAFAASLDHLGPFATTVADLATCYDAMQGPDSADPACAQRPVEPTLAGLDDGASGPRTARLTGYFDRFATDRAAAASHAAALALGATEEIEIPDMDAARAAAFVITAAEGGARQLETLRHHYEVFEPHSRDRFLAGALTPAAWYVRAQRVRSWFRERLREVFARFDLLIAPATPDVAPLLGSDWLELDGQRLPMRPSIGLLTQPLSFVGLPIVAAPIVGHSPLPIAVQLIAAPWREDICLRAAAALERAGIARCVMAPGSR
jgi:1-carboxybiuret hydrolase